MANRLVISGESNSFFMKVSKSSFDVETTPAKNLLFNTDEINGPPLSIQTGSVNFSGQNATVTYTDRGYKPVVFFYFTGTSGNYSKSLWLSTTLNYTVSIVSVTNTTVIFVRNKGGTTYPTAETYVQSIRYMILNKGI